MSMTKCNHDDGWVTIDHFAFDEKEGGEDITVTAECNTIGCGEVVKFSIGIIINRRVAQ